MSIELKKILRSVKLQLSAEEFEVYQRNLEQKANSFKNLLAVNTDNVEPMIYGNEKVVSHWRDDVSVLTNNQSELLSNTKSESGYFVVPKVIS